MKLKPQNKRDQQSQNGNSQRQERKSQLQIETDPTMPKLVHQQRSEKKITDERKRKNDSSKNATGKMKKVDESFLVFLKEQQKEFIESENKRWDEEKVREDNLRREERDHEMRLFSMFADILKGQTSDNNLLQQTTRNTTTNVPHTPSKSDSANYSSCSLQPCSPTRNQGSSSMSFLRMLNDEYY